MVQMTYYLPSKKNCVTGAMGLTSNVVAMVTSHIHDSIFWRQGSNVCVRSSCLLCA